MTDRFPRIITHVITAQVYLVKKTPKQNKPLQSLEIFNPSQQKPQHPPEF